ncbi:MAG: glycosyltransferase, partial [Cyclobacteriaceae bacterium]|nr:glycosyltransferase [Cyclobacteriaceae bacterium]
KSWIPIQSIVKFAILNKSFSVLVTPLDWGLGHATRCIPIIRAFLDRDWKVLIATSGDALQLLKLEFPEVTFFEIVSYKAAYSKDGRLLPKLLLQSFKFVSAIRKEHRQLEQILRKNPVDLVISDNRFGCYSKNVKSIFVTHQINFIFRSPFKWASRLFSFWNQQKIKQFNECWVPDFPDRPFSGDLSLTRSLPVVFVGSLSRFRKSAQQYELKYDVLVLLSGPEPQRTILEGLITQQLTKHDLKVMFVLGKPYAGDSVVTNGQISRVGHLRVAELQCIIEESRFVVCRSGYSSILDLAALQKKNLIMIPTPGQPEQEYLAECLRSKNWVYTVTQQDFDLAKAIDLAVDFLGLNCGEVGGDLLRGAIDRLERSSHRK